MAACIIGGTGLFLLALYVIHSNLLAIVSLFLMVLPVFLINAVIKIFRREVFIDFHADSFSIKIVKDEAEQGYPLNEVSSYNIQFTNRRFSAIRVNLKKGGGKEYSFLNNKIAPDQTETPDLINSFAQMIGGYNSGMAESEKIPFQPSFYASTSGLGCIFILSFLAIVAVAVHFYYQAKTAPVTLFFAVAVIVQLLIKRKTELDYYKKMAAKS
jgi:hypothetical protein